MKPDIFPIFSHQKATNFLFAIVSVFLMYLLGTALPAHAQGTMVVNEEIPQNEVIEIPEPLLLRNESVVLTGTGEPGAKLKLTVLRNQDVIFTQETTVDEVGSWEVTLPAFSEPPTQILVNVQVEYTVEKAVETVTVTAAVATGSFVLLQIILERLIRVLQIAGLLGRKKTRGFVYDVTTKKPVPFSILTIESNFTQRDGSIGQLKETVVSSVDGFFKTIALPPGTYTIKVDHPNYSFPVQIARPWYATKNEFYQGEPFDVTNQKELDIIFIPLQPTGSGQISITHWLDLRVLASLITQVTKILSLPMGILSVVLLILYPSFINFALTSLYLVLGAYYLLTNSAKRKLGGTIVNATTHEPIEKAIVRVYNTAPDELAAVTLTDNRGRFRVQLPQGDYRVLFSKDTYVPVENQGLSFETIGLKKNRTDLAYTMTPAGQPAR